MGRPKGSKNKNKGGLAGYVQVDAKDVREIIIKNIGCNTMPLDLDVNYVTSFKDLPKGEMIEFGTQHGLSKMEAITKFHDMTGTYPTEMYCQLRWFIPIDRKLIEKIKKEKKNDK